MTLQTWLWEIRRKVSLLLSHGHLDAMNYPLGFLGDEAQLIVERVNSLMVTEGTIMQGAAASIMGKKGVEHFNGLLKQLLEN